MPEHNYALPWDVNLDSLVTALDALLIINQISRSNSSTSSSTADGTDTDPVNRCDTSGDGIVSALDALRVINSLSGSQFSTPTIAPISTPNPDPTDTGSTDTTGGTDTTDNSGTDTTDGDSTGSTDPTNGTDTTTTDGTDSPSDNGDTASPPDNTDTTDNTDDGTDTTDTGTGTTDDNTDSTDNGGTDDDTTDNNTDDGTDTTDNTDGTDTTDDGTDTTDDETDTTDDSNDDHQDCPSPGSQSGSSDHSGHHLPPAPNGSMLLGILGTSAENFVSRFDTSADGSLSEDELPPRLWAKFISLDADTDGDDTLSLDEVDALIASVMKSHFDNKDTNSDGQLTADEVGDRLWASLGTADSDSSDSVSFDEFKTGFKINKTIIPLPTRMTTKRVIVTNLFMVIAVIRSDCHHCPATLAEQLALQ